MPIEPGDDIWYATPPPAPSQAPAVAPAPAPAPIVVPAPPPIPKGGGALAHVGEKINGWALLDQAVFDQAVIAKMRASILALPDMADPGYVTNTYEYGSFWFNREAGQFGLNIGDTHDFKGLYTGGRATFAVPFELAPYITISGYIEVGDSGSRPTYALNLGAARQAMLNKLAEPKTVFLFDGEQGTGPRERIWVAYQRYSNVVVALAVKPYYSPSGWVSARGGVIFVATALFAAYNAAAAVEAAGAGATGAAQGFTQVVGSYGQLSGDKNLGIIAKVAGAVNGQIGDTATPSISSGLDAGALESGTGTMDFFSSDFDGFNFSSGESTVAFSDAQNVDYGFNWGSGSFAEPDSYVIPNDDFFGSDVYDFGSGTGLEYNFNATPEVSTNDFGTVFDSRFGVDDVASAAKGVQIAQQVANAKSPAPTTGNKATSGANGAKQTTGVGDALSGMGRFLSGVANTAKSVSGVVAQSQSVLPKTYTGQLKAGGGAPAGGGMSPVLLIGGVIALVAVVYFVKKG